MLSILLLVALFALSLPVIKADIPGDLIASLPGYGTTATKQYSGLIPADEAQTVFIHYWFVTTASASTDPVTVWMNGGPGCSSLEGFLYELGPYGFTGETGPDGIPTLMDNPYAWSTASNMLFIDQPAGVSFSYAVNGSTTTDDYVQSQNTYGFLLNFFKGFPEFSTNPFFITGESYAGIYVPTLANRILDGNAAGNPKINLMGIAVGDGCIGNAVGTCGDGPDSQQIEIDFYRGAGLISRVLYEAIYVACDNFVSPNFSQACLDLLNDANAAVGNIYVYDIYDTCPGNDNNAVTAFRPPRAKHSRAPNRVVKKVADPIVCVSGDLITTYLDAPAVRTALHVDKVTLNEWDECSAIDYNSNIVSLLPLYPKLIKNMNVLIYSGTGDACVPWVGSYNWTTSLGYAETTPMRPWTTTVGQMSWESGYVTQWGNNFAYITVKKAGHMVPQYEPEAALTFFTAFLKGTVPQ